MTKLTLNIKRIVYPLIIIACLLIIILLTVVPCVESYKYDFLYNNQSAVVGTVISSKKNYINYSTKVNVNDSVVNIKTPGFISKGVEIELIETGENEFVIKSEIDQKYTSLNLSENPPILFVSIGLILVFFTGFLVKFLFDDYVDSRFIYNEKLKRSKKDEICKEK